MLFRVCISGLVGLFILLCVYVFARSHSARPHHAEDDAKKKEDASRRSNGSGTTGNERSTPTHTNAQW